MHPRCAHHGLGLLPIGFTLGIIAACLKGKAKWQALTAIITAVIGTIVGIIVFFAVVATSFSNAFGDTDVEIASGDDTSVVEEGRPPRPKKRPPRNPREPVVVQLAYQHRRLGCHPHRVQPERQRGVTAGNPYNEAPGDGQQYVVLDLAATYKGADEGTSMMVEVDYVTADGTVISSWDSSSPASSRSSGRQTFTRAPRTTARSCSWCRPRWTGSSACSRASSQKRCSSRCRNDKHHKGRPGRARADPASPSRCPRRKRTASTLHPTRGPSDVPA